MHRALLACKLGRTTAKSWRNVPLLLELARRERIELLESSIVLAVEAYAPPAEEHEQIVAPREPGALGQPGSEENRPSIEQTLNELASALNVYTSPATMRRLYFLCDRSPAAASHAHRLHATLKGAMLNEKSTQSGMAAAARGRGSARDRFNPRGGDGSHAAPPGSLSANGVRAAQTAVGVVNDQARRRDEQTAGLESATASRRAAAAGADAGDAAMTRAQADLEIVKLVDLRTEMLAESRADV